MNEFLSIGKNVLFEMNNHVPGFTDTNLIESKENYANEDDFMEVSTGQALTEDLIKQIGRELKTYINIFGRDIL